MFEFEGILFQGLALYSAYSERCYPFGTLEWLDSRLVLNPSVLLGRGYGCR